MRTQLLTHNKIAYQKVIKALEVNQRTCVVHPTGTGKSYLIAAVSEGYSKVLILGPNDFVLNQVHDVLEWRKKGVDYMTYQMLALTENMPTGYDLICLDEFHRAGAPSWGVAVDELLAANTQAKIFGTSATPIRYLDNERNMADELFHNNVASHIGIGEAWSRNILPIPAFVIGMFNFHKTIEEAERRINDSRKLSPEEKRKRIFKLSNARLEWEQSIGMPSILRRHLDANIKRVIIFCADIARLESMRDTVIGWFRMGGFKVNSACTVHIGQTDKQLRQAMAEFESDEGEGVRLMFSVNMLNEGVHIPRVGAVLMLRTTASRIIYMQQMGRCLTAANTEKPVILDMVDNITTTSAIHGLQEDFMGWEKFTKEDLDDTERRFNVTDYRQSVRDVLEKLSPLELSFESVEERIAMVLDFCEKKGRTPTSRDGDIFRHYQYLLNSCRDMEEVKFIIQKYGQAIYWNENNKDFMLQELREFIDTKHRAPNRWLVEDLRWYKMLKVIMRNEPEHPIVLECKRLEEQRKAEERDRYRQECINDLREFTDREHRMPKSKAKEDGTYEPYGRVKWLRKNYPNDPEFMAICEKYGVVKKAPREVLPLDERIDLCEAICKKYNRQPHAAYDDLTTVRSWTYLKRLHPDNPRVQELMKYPVLDSNHKRIERGIKKVEDFYDKHGRLPFSRTNGREELQALNSMVNIFEKYPDNPRVARLMAIKSEMSVPVRQAIDKVLAFEKETGRLPNSTPEEINLRSTWVNLRDKYADLPEVAALIARHPEDTTDGRKEAAYRRKMEFHLNRLGGFFDKTGRWPKSVDTVDEEERHAYDSFVCLRNNYQDEPEVIALFEKKPALNDNMEDNVRHLLAWEQANGRLPRDTRDASPDERRALSTLKTMKKNYPDHPVTKMLMAKYPYGTSKLGMAIQMFVDFEKRWHRLPTSRANGVEGEAKVHEKMVYLRQEHSDNPIVKEILDRYKDFDPRLEITREVVARIDAWSAEHGRLPKKNKNDRDENNIHNSLVRMMKLYPDMPELVALLEKYK